MHAATPANSTTPYPIYQDFQHQAVQKHEGFFESGASPVVLTPAPAGLPADNISVTLKVLATAPARPLIPAGGVVNGASFASGVAANSLATIRGSNLASITDNWNSSLASGQLPTSLDGVTVLYNGNLQQTSQRHGRRSTSVRRAAATTPGLSGVFRMGITLFAMP